MRAGFPAATESAGTLRVTTAPAPTTARSPIVTPGQTIAPPLLFTSTAPFVEDLLLGITDEDGLIGTGMKVEQSADLDHDQAMAVIAEHTKFGRGSSRIE